MADVIQSSFNAGEWSPKLYARVDIAKYRSGAALLENFFVDYRGGASTRPGTRYVNKARSADTVRLIPFQASLGVSYVLEFGQNYIRFYSNGAPVLESFVPVSAVTQANPGVFTSIAHPYSNGDWLVLSTFGGMSALSGKTAIVANATANTYTLVDLFGNPIDTSALPAYTGGGQTQRIYTISSPYLASEVFGIKYAQNVSTLILCHPNYPPYQLVLTSATNWALSAITFGATISAPTGLSIGSSGLAAGNVFYAYRITAVDSSGQESSPSATLTLSSLQDLRTVPGSIQMAWGPVAGAVSYNVYKAEVNYGGAVPSGAAFGYIGNATGTAFVDSNIGPDFSQGIPQVQNPFSGSGVQTLTLTSSGTTYQSVPAVVFTPSPGITATAEATLGLYSVSVDTGGNNYVVGDVLGLDSPSFGAFVLVTAVTPGFGAVTGVSVYQPGSISGVGTGVPPTPRNTIGGSGSGCRVNLAWNVRTLTLTSPGTGYLLTPSVNFSGGSPGAAATATCTLGAPSAGNPTVPGFFQQRFVLGGLVQSPAQFNMSQPGAYYNYNVTFPTQGDNAIQGTLVDGQLNSIKSFIPMPSGLIILTDRKAWLVNGGGSGSAIDATSIVANSQAYNGASDVPPIVANYDALYVQAKGGVVRNLSYNFYTNVYAGADITTQSSHLFTGYTVVDWAWAEEPFKLVWTVRSDGTMLTLTFLKEQEFVAWSHSITTNGAFKSVATVVETTENAGAVDAVYCVVQRTIQGQTVNYIERVTERIYPRGVVDAWCVDCGIGYSGTPVTSFAGAEFLGGQVVTGLADGVVIPPFTMAADGTFTLATPASQVVIGLGFTAKLQTLPLEIGEPTVQAKLKKINALTIKVAETLGIDAGAFFSTVKRIKDLEIGEVSGMLTGQPSQIVTNLVDGDAYITMDPTYTIPGQICIQQSQPLPATILGVVPNFTIGDGGQRG